jgi:hypothetical protein
VRLTCDEVEAALYALHDLVYRRTLAGRSIPKEVKGLYYRLCAGSEDGTENISGPPELETEELIGTAEAANILACSREWVRRIASDLDGQVVEGRWVFPRRSVVEYVAAKGVDCDGSGIPPDGGGAVSTRAA